MLTSSQSLTTRVSTPGVAFKVKRPPRRSASQHLVYPTFPLLVEQTKPRKRCAF